MTCHEKFSGQSDDDSLVRHLQHKDIADTIVGAKTGLRSAIEKVEQVAHIDTPVLILGETGTGKEVIARTIHERSLRSGGPIFRVNCGAIPPTLVDSELFGHEKGSFTGAIGARKGWFERADGGTLFLDEVSELSLAAQVRMLRVLQDGIIERVGGQSKIKVDVRLITATNADLEAMVENGAFRRDLWYRISVFPISLPPLRDRTGDIPALALHFARRAGKRFKGEPLVPTTEDIQLLVSHSWPGNIRELAAVIERAAIIGGGKCLDIASALKGTENKEASTLALPTKKLTSSENRDRFMTLDELVIYHIQNALERTGGRIDGPHGAAALLGVNPSTLRSRMRKLGIDRNRFKNK